MDFAGMTRSGVTPYDLRDPAAVRLWARNLGIPETELKEAIAIAGPSADAVLFYLHVPD